jgi:hypothetical protein
MRETRRSEQKDEISDVSLSLIRCERLKTNKESAKNVKDYGMTPLVPLGQDQTGL